MRALYDVGFLKLRKDGLWSLYSFNWEGMDSPLKDILEVTRRAFENNEQMKMDRERLKTAERVGPGCVNKLCRAQCSPAAS